MDWVDSIYLLLIVIPYWNNMTTRSLFFVFVWPVRWRVHGHKVENLVTTTQELSIVNRQKKKEGHKESAARTYKKNVCEQQTKNHCNTTWYMISLLQEYYSSNAIPGICIACKRHYSSTVVVVRSVQKGTRNKAYISRYMAEKRRTIYTTEPGQ